MLKDRVGGSVGKGLHRVPPEAAIRSEGQEDHRDEDQKQARKKPAQWRSPYDEASPCLVCPIIESSLQMARTLDRARGSP